MNEKEIFDPSKILQNLNQSVIKALKQEETDNHDGMDVCLCRIEKLETNKYEIVYAGEKLPLYYYSLKTRQIAEVKADRISIGGIRKRNKDVTFTNTRIELEKGDLLFMLSDGLIDQNNQQRKRFGTTKLLQVLNKNANLPLSIQHEIIETT